MELFSGGVNVARVFAAIRDDLFGRARFAKRPTDARSIRVIAYPKRAAGGFSGIIDQTAIASGTPLFVSAILAAQ